MAHQSKSKKDRKTSAWYQRHVNDPHVKRAQKEGRRSRAVFKLMEILDSHMLNIRKDSVIVDLGCAPGSWCEEIASRLDSQGLLIGIDLLPLNPIEGVTLIQADFDSPDGQQALAEALKGRVIDLIVSDMAPEMSGNKLVDQMRMIALNEMTLQFARQNLKPGGDLLMKTFMGEGYDMFRRDLGMTFTRVKNIKPEASRKTSSEFFLLAREMK
ncbi:MAG: 23S rRNA methyltransferase [Zetaproteobacteria bacterium CG_4_9_14_3_um_filter_49_83]|nr:MAG: 23S rRNA methyltransferase [Zetaproteobacteria bacterium CG1_02_49_23]PIQ33771.1 MAG: 23S rRNA methyltransferase [Zetaproteobacteria bacterium CG17_big_fil_post_rev_8_21_14_2_50_50_13]PIV29985.1 MAG: 23S rRNA methyltransferase [Zetaproteobacteria bacterium CG02_land_8_20_14_3_00_50_9]PIY55089.1 MAG: 23S rRNA methyltransferase [Zetaproteobacteria bacterium CG_4_10_14_0_8_um_filter_49_80]PJA36555.1 MAG: 23S rRNA methyltransferase [Zetaproteobacteria bacterium CG_4_9_14_3_um_filter_49_83]